MSNIHIKKLPSGIDSYTDAKFIYCGRGKKEKNDPTKCHPPDIGVLGNPVSIGKKCLVCSGVHETGGSTLPCYERYLRNRLIKDYNFKKYFFKQKGKTLVCFCPPNPCHTDIMLSYLEKKICFFAGIGSRETPAHILDIMERISRALTQRGAILRSGGAKGADTAFERGVAYGNKEIFYAKDSTQEANELAMNFHPNPNALKNKGEYVVNLMGRNMLIMSGEDLITHVDFVVCWTKDGKASGGTGQAMRYAESLGIKIYNMYYEKDIDELREFVKKYYDLGLI